MSFTPKLKRKIPDGLSERIALEQKIVDKAVGKTIVKVKASMRTTDPDVHDSGVLMMEFTDGSIL